MHQLHTYSTDETGKHNVTDFSSFMKQHWCLIIIIMKCIVSSSVLRKHRSPPLICQLIPGSASVWPHFLLPETTSTKNNCTFPLHRRPSFYTTPLLAEKSLPAIQYWLASQNNVTTRRQEPSNTRDGLVFLLWYITVPVCSWGSCRLIQKQRGSCHGRTQPQTGSHQKPGLITKDTNNQNPNFICFFSMHVQKDYWDKVHSLMVIRIHRTARFGASTGCFESKIHKNASPLVSSASARHLRGRKACSLPPCTGWLHLHVTENTQSSHLPCSCRSSHTSSCCTAAHRC